MQYTGIISRFNFMPMVEIVPSILHFWVTIREIDFEIMLEDRGSIEYLSSKYEFTIVSPYEWDFTGFVGSQCNILRNDSGFHFISFV